uniref:Uncharacterized protein n=1 Tax=Aquila chrysaetos chrysaetos TaxID=223781 RepID=A0A663DKG3_AQUCH
MTCVFLPIALSMPPSLDRDPNCLASLPSNSTLLAPLSQHRSSQVTMCSPGWRLKSFRMSRNSLRDRERVIISGSASSSCSRDDPGSSSSLTERTDFFVCFFFCTGATDTGTGWFSGLAAVSVTAVGVAALPVAGVGVATVPVAGAGVATVPAAGAGVATVPAAGAGVATVPAAGAGVATVPAAGAGVATVPAAGAGHIRTYKTPPCKQINQHCD